jgi:dTDP-4-dehydrorhamnose 3,5-epimerase-like enzyme
MAMVRTVRVSAQAFMLTFPVHVDARGTLVEVDFRALPFRPRRAFVVEGTEAGTVRGGHAHKRCRQILMCVQGVVTVETAGPEGRRTDVLASPTQALLVPARVWSRQIFDEARSRLLVLASHYYDPDSYLDGGPTGAA